MAAMSSMMSVRPIGMDGQRLGGEDNESDGVAKDKKREGNDIIVKTIFFGIDDAG